MAGPVTENRFKMAARSSPPPVDRTWPPRPRPLPAPPTRAWLLWELCSGVSGSGCPKAALQRGGPGGRPVAPAAGPGRQPLRVRAAHRAPGLVLRGLQSAGIIGAPHPTPTPALNSLCCPAWPQALSPPASASLLGFWACSPHPTHEGLLKIHSGFRLTSNGRPAPPMKGQLQRKAQREKFAVSG
ncbi:PREDICTED: 39S ribosomal protein L52, mitochondrial isoform X2 [Chinchilla lanigera]|uniref:39S ribosomal protein L52, mitochondrial isoform X2 n=1 Tax=Chinchilla lanigera TaxID=34839 RepID=UPI0006973FCB|nr:PREDICTED: 39S ribosomal protein L52, mitochondrial isoform X2 [Chinchilla lanigera]